MELLKELCESTGIPGQEGRLREIARRELAPLADGLTVDALGNLIARKAATKKRKKTGPPPRKLMIAAHMDEIGFVVSHIDDKGWLRLVPLGGLRQEGRSARPALPGRAATTHRHAGGSAQGTEGE